MNAHAAPPPGTSGAPRPRRRVVLAMAALVLTLTAVAWHLTALTAYRATAGGAPLASRLASARLAATLEPWDTRFGWRVATLRGEQLLDEGRIDPAFWLLQSYSQIVRDDPLYREAYQRAVSLKTPLDARKAHIQHAREQTGGVLRDEDVIP